MDEQTVRRHAQAHGEATVAGDLRKAGADLTTEAMAQAPGVMKAMPGKLTSCEIASVDGQGDEFVALIRYMGDAGEIMVASRWAERDDRPKITDLQVRR